MKRKIFMREISDLQLEEAFERFIKLKVATNRAEETIKFYKERFRWFNAYLKEHKGIFLTTQINDDCITDYILHIREQSPKCSANNLI